MHIFQKQKQRSLIIEVINVFFLVLVKHGVLEFDAKNEVAAVVRVPIPPGRYGVLTQVKDELSYVTVYNDCGDVFMFDMYGALHMSLNRSVCIYLGHKKSRQTLEKDPFVDNGTMLCNVLPSINSGDDIVAIYTTERIYLYYLNGQKVEIYYYDSRTIKS